MTKTLLFSLHKRVSWQRFLIGLNQRLDFEIKYGMERCTSDPEN